MQTMLNDREEDSLRSQSEMARSMLQMSVESIPNLTNDWAELVYMHDYATGESDSMLKYFENDRTYELNKLNILTVLDSDNQPIFERFYNYGEGTELKHDADMQNVYGYLGDSSIRKYTDAVSADDLSEVSMGTDGFVGEGDYVYYVSAYPIASLEEDRPFAGTFVFGRIIDAEELDAMMSDTGVQFTVTSLDRAGIGEEDGQRLLQERSILVTDAEFAAGYAAFEDIYGNRELLVSVRNPRTLYSQGQGFINLMIILVAVGCVIVWLVLLNLMDRIVLRPLGSLVLSVDGLGRDSTSIPNDYKDREMTNLAGSINNMLERMDTYRDTIKRKNESLYYKTNFDSLTNLRNRVSAVKTLNEAIEEANKEGREVTVYYLDLHRFKYVNDSFGHAVGDRLIQQIAQRLLETIGPNDEVARMGGDKFMIYSRDLLNDTQRKLFADELMQAVFGKPYMVKERALDVYASVGSSVYPRDGGDADMIVKHAEIAMYVSKDDGRSLYTEYESKFQDMFHEKVLIENRLRAVINDDCRELRAFFQPKVSMETGKIERCEALMRWLTPEGLISPADFIPQAEESGLIVPMTWWMIRECCKQGKRFDELGIPMSVAINVPAQVLVHDDFMDVLLGAVAEAGIDITRLDVEITEGTLLEDMEKVNIVLSELHRLGVEISVDDFGTGYSSLSYLHQISVDRIKIDRSFISRLDEDKDSHAIVRAVLAMAKGLEMVVTAEGVESNYQYTFLKNIGCDEAQGYMISRPLPVDEYIEFICQRKKETGEDDTGEEAFSD